MNRFSQPSSLLSSALMSASFAPDSRCSSSAALPNASVIPDEIAKHISPGDKGRLVRGDLKAYLPVVIEVFKAMEFTRDLPEMSSDDRNNRVLREAYRKNSPAAARAPQIQRTGVKDVRSRSAPRQLHRSHRMYHLPLAEVVREEQPDSSAPWKPRSPLNGKNLFLTFFYSRFYQALCRSGDVDFNDETTQQEITEVSRIVRHALQACKDDSYFPGSAGKDIPVHDLGMVLACFGKFARAAGISPEKIINAAPRFFIEKQVLDAMREEFGFEPDNPLLVFMYDTEENYAKGLAQGWLHASSLISRLHRESVAALGVKDIETLHRTCTSSVKHSDGRPIDSTMGNVGVRYALFQRRGLTDAGIDEWRRLYGKLNAACDKVIEDRALPGTSRKLLTLTEYKRPWKQGGDWVEMRRNTLYSNDAEGKGRAVVRALAAKLIDDFRDDIRRACEHEKADGTPATTEKIGAVIGLCQSLERLHPYPDSNGRVFEFLLPNVLLVALGLGPYAPVEPYRFDGAARDDMQDEIMHGRREAETLMPPATQSKDAQPDSDSDTEDAVTFVQTLAEMLLLFMP